MGRDQYVRVVHKGYLFPFGHRAAYIQVTERTIEPMPEGSATAYLRTRAFLVVREPVKTFTDASASANQARAMTYKRITITTSSTPNLDDPRSAQIADLGDKGFWPHVSGQPFRFHLVGEDWEGHVAEWSQPLIFVDCGLAPHFVRQILRDYNGIPPEDVRRRCEMSGQKVAYARAGKPGDTTLPTLWLSFKASRMAPRHVDEPGFWPELDQAHVKVEALEQLQHGSGPGGVTVTLADQYLKHNLGGTGNVGELFLTLVEAPLVAFAAEHAGGVATPNFSIVGLSRLLGPVGGQSVLPELARGVPTDPREVAGFVETTLKAEAAKRLGIPIGKLPTSPEDLKKLLEAEATSLLNKRLKAEAAKRLGIPIGSLPTSPEELEKLLIETLRAKAAAWGLPDKVPTTLAGARDFLKANATKFLESNVEAYATSLARAALGEFNPQHYLDSSAKLLGGISLQDILRTTTFNADPTKAPVIKTRPIYPGDQKKDPRTGLPRLPIAIETTLAWTPETQSFPEAQPVFINHVGDKKAVLTINALIKAELGKEPIYTMSGELTNFSINLLPSVVEVIQVTFSRLRFTSSAGMKPHVDVDLLGVQFKGPLAFVNDLRPYLEKALGVAKGDVPQQARATTPPLLGLGDGAEGEPVLLAAPTAGGFSVGPSYDITPAGLTVGYGLAIPSVSLGAIGIQNIKLSAALDLPFNGDPVLLRFAFCERSDPFTLTVFGFAGGGFIAVHVSAHGIERFEGALEFGGNLSLNLGVASGGVHVMAGIYFQRDKGTDTTTLNGYLRCGGALRVLGLITVSVEFYMDLSYQEIGGRTHVVGQATLTVKVEIAFFSKSVSLHVEREFAGSAASADLTGQPHLAALRQAAPAAPHFRDAMTQPDWDSYVNAFAS